MKSFLYSILFLTGLLVCGCTAKKSSDPNEINPLPTQEPTNPNTKILQSSLNISDCLVATSDKKLEIVTWNVEHFPIKPYMTEMSEKKREKIVQKRIEEFAYCIQNMNVDILALQEIRDKKSLDQLLSYLPDYKGVIMQRSQQNLAFIYKKSEITLNKKPYGILKYNQKEFAGRTPFLLPIHSKSTGLDIILINTHLKAFGDNKSQKKRFASCRLLKNWIDSNHPNDNVIVLGDMNDIITDSKKQNVFQVFLNDSPNYQFADMEIAQDNNKIMWSYQGKRHLSHLDHIIITNELFDNQENTYTYTFESCDRNYKNVVSDHQPVCLVLSK
ncbi:MAG: endonuclease/exonuclease/phosphatase family protein [Flavobacteriaceae bacterium]|nr:endonuclease/exonuclease/phosphatase family protein [Flavobacteriaceae bacterium]